MVYETHPEAFFQGREIIKEKQQPKQLPLTTGNKASRGLKLFFIFLIIKEVSFRLEQLANQ
jgi:hypothetical protein